MDRLIETICSRPTAVAWDGIVGVKQNPVVNDVTALSNARRRSHYDSETFELLALELAVKVSLRSLGCQVGSCPPAKSFAQDFLHAAIAFHNVGSLLRLCPAWKVSETAKNQKHSMIGYLPWKGNNHMDIIRSTERISF